MRQRAHPPKAAQRRTTLTLPAGTLASAERLARVRKVKLSTVIAEALDEGLRIQTAAERSEELLRLYQRAFSGFSENDVLLLDGILLGPPDPSQ